MFMMKDLEKYIGKAKIVVNDIEFKLTKDIEISNESAVWVSKEFKVKATPDFGKDPIPVKFMELIDGDWYTIDVDRYYGEINNFEEYMTAVQDLTMKKLLCRQLLMVG
jgi:hypothetical protein